VAIDFINRRPYDQIGLIAFSGGAFTQCPLTDDRRILQAFIANLQVGRLEDGTAIGNGIATAVNRLRTGTAKSKVVIVLTDGENNAGDIGPVQAAELATALGVKVHIIGVGTEGNVLSPSYQRDDGTFVFAARQMTFDSTRLKQVAQLGGGEFYRARSAAELERVYEAIDRLEKSKVEISTLQRTQELFPWFVNIAFCILLIEMLLRWGPLRVITV
jgi:Ca-activated chloride channel homolog